MKQYLFQVAHFFRYAWGFSFFINLCLLITPLYMLQVYDRVLTSRSIPTLLMLTLGVFLIILVYTGLEILRSKILVQAGVALDGLLSPKILNQLFSKSVSLGNQQQLPTRDIAVLRQYLTGNGIFAFFDAPWAVVFLAIIFIMHWALGVVALIGMLVLFFLALIDEKQARPKLLDANNTARQSNQYIDSALRNRDVINAMGMRESVIQRWQVINQKVMFAQVTASDSSGIYLGSTKGFRTLLQSIMLGLGAYLVISQNLSSGIMITATILFGKATAPIELAISGWKGFIDARASYNRLDDLITNHTKQDNKMLLPSPEGKLSIKGLTYTNSEKNAPIINDLSFQLAAGESLAIIGASAAGKSTLLKLILGLWQPQAGEVRLDDANIKDWQEDQLGKFIGYLPQDISLMSGTVAENIARMNDAKQASEAIVSAAKLAGAHEMILKLSNGYDTLIEDNGTSLSGGQRQRIGLARAIFNQPKLIVLDEPNSNLDNEGENALIATIKNLKALKSTLIFVTHKPSLVNFADKLMILEAGKLLAYGPTAMVLAKLQAGQTQPETKTDNNKGSKNKESNKNG